MLLVHIFRRAARLPHRYYSFQLCLHGSRTAYDWCEIRRFPRRSFRPLLLLFTTLLSLLLLLSPSDSPLVPLPLAPSPRLLSFTLPPPPRPHLPKLPNSSQRISMDREQYVQSLLRAEQGTAVLPTSTHALSRLVSLTFSPLIRFSLLFPVLALLPIHCSPSRRIHHLRRPVDSARPVTKLSTAFATISTTSKAVRFSCSPFSPRTKLTYATC